MKTALVALLLLACAAPARATSLLLEGEINEGSVTTLMSEMMASQDEEALIIRINSPGGGMKAGFILSRFIEVFPARITCIVDGKAASMAMYILQSCHRRVMTKRSVLLIHEPTFPGAERYRPSEFWSDAEYAKAVTFAMAEHLAHRMQCTADTILHRIDGGREWWFTWKDAKRWGAVDQIVDRPSEVKP